MTERTMGEIEALAEDFASKRQALAEAISDLEEEVRQVRNLHMKSLRELVGQAADAHGLLQAAISGSPRLFERPRTRVLHGIKVGFRKQPGQVEYADAAQVVRLIRRHLAEQADTLIKVTETPVKSALAQLSVAELKKIGATLGETGDEVFIRPADSEIDKLVDALLADALLADDDAGDDAGSAAA